MAEIRFISVHGARGVRDGEPLFLLEIVIDIFYSVCRIQKNKNCGGGIKRIWSRRGESAFAKVVSQKLSIDFVIVADSDSTWNPAFMATSRAETKH